MVKFRCRDVNVFKGRKVLLLDGFARQALPMLQAFHELGCHITTVNRSYLDNGYISRFPNRRLIVRSQKMERQEYKNALLDIVKNDKFDLVLPLIDPTAILLSENKEEFERFSNVAVNEWNVFQFASDKLKTMIACVENGIPCPRTVMQSDDIEEVLSAEISYPLVIKPRTGYGSIGFHIVRNESELIRLFEKTRIEHGELLVQEFVPQTGKQYKCEAFIDRNGTPKSVLIMDKTRWYPVDGGSTCCSMTVGRSDIRDNCIKLLSIIGWRGYADIDLIEDPRDKKVKVMEINPRITACVKISFVAGINFARQILENALGMTVTEYTDYRKNVLLRYFHTDILWLLQSPNRFSAKPSWFRFWNMSDQIFSWKDPLPFLSYSIQAVLKYKTEMTKRQR